MITVFTLASGRSGTSFLTGLFAANVKNCVALHEPVPFLNAMAIRWYDNGQEDLIEREFAKTKDRIASLDAAAVPVYLESSHVFLKSYCDVAMRHFPAMKLVYLIRNPLEVAESEIRRQRKVSLDNPYTLLPTLPIFQGLTLTEYQKYLVHWIEMQNRAIAFLNRYNKWRVCAIMETPEDINSPLAVRRMFALLEIPTHTTIPAIVGMVNNNYFPTVCGPEHEEQMRDVVRQLDEKYLTIFRQLPFTRLQGHWKELLLKPTA